MGSPDPLKSDTEPSIILFDGVCNLCNGAVQFIIKRDRRKKFKFASLQSPAGQRYINRYSITNRPDLYSLLLITRGKIYDRSNAVLKIARELSGLWPALYIFIILPTFLRDAAYKLVARNRYRLFGKRDECMIPTPELKARFLE